jgi:adenosylcobinamide-phosphate synthase
VYFEVALIAYLVDKFVGELKFIRHPVVIMGDFIKLFEKLLYKDSVFRGTILTLSLITLVFLVSFTIQNFLSESVNYYLGVVVSGLITSTTIASKMLYDSVQDIIKHPKNIKYLVSRDTESLNESGINKAAIETYAENLSDGVIAPLFYLLLFGLHGAFVYKAINTLDSMVGYRNKKYEKFGKFSAKLDDVVNYIPARITAVLIAILMFSQKALTHFYSYGKKHDSPNAGHPISAMALSLGITLGGDTSYFGKIKAKPYFGEGRESITKEDIENALSLQPKLDIFIILFLSMGVVL